MPVKAIVEKSVDGKFAIGLRYHYPDIESGESISAVTCVISPTGDANDLETVGAVVIDPGGKEFKWTVQKGRAGIDYDVLFKVTFDSGKIFNHPVRESVRVSIVS
jgi:hypothetical protein